MVDEQLVRKAGALLASNHFVSLTEDGALAEKQCVFLALCGKKPVSEATSSTIVVDGNGRHTIPEDEQALGDFLSELGLKYSLRSDEYATDAVISLDQTLLGKYISSNDTHEVGRLLGYPESATQAFVDGECISFEDQEQMMQEAGLPIIMPQFRLSKANARAGIAILQDWYGILKTYNLA